MKKLCSNLCSELPYSWPSPAACTEHCRNSSTLVLRRAWRHVQPTTASPRPSSLVLSIAGFEPPYFLRDLVANALTYANDRTLIVLHLNCASPAGELSVDALLPPHLRLGTRATLPKRLQR